MKKYQSIFKEKRPTQLFNLVLSIKRSVPEIERLITTNYTYNGIIALYRTKDGNAYQFEIKPAAYADREKYGAPQVLGKEKKKKR